MSKDTFRLPAEWEPHEATLLEWAGKGEEWTGKPVEPIYSKTIHALLQGEDVHLFCRRKNRDIDKLLRSIKRWGVSSSQIVTHWDVEAVSPSPTGHQLHLWMTSLQNRWLRDRCPLTLCNEEGERKMVIFEDADRERLTAARKVATIFGSKLSTVGMHVEGGSLDSNGEGTLLTSEGLYEGLPIGREHEEQLDTIIQQQLCTKRQIQIHSHIVGDVNKHVDLIARFIKTSTIAHCVEEEKRRPNYGPTQMAREELQESYLFDGTKPNRIELPCPIPIRRDDLYDKEPWPASYANFYIANSCVLVPVFRGKNTKKDREVLKIFENLFPGRTIVPFDSSAIAGQDGSIHCLTMQIPARQGGTGSAQPAKRKKK